MSAADYWDSLAEAEQVGMPAGPPVVVRWVGTHFECFIGGRVLTSSTEEGCWRKVREFRPQNGVCAACGLKHHFAKDCEQDGHVPRPRRKAA